MYNFLVNVAAFSERKAIYTRTNRASNICTLIDYTYVYKRKISFLYTNTGRHKQSKRHCVCEELTRANISITKILLAQNNSFVGTGHVWIASSIPHQD